MHVCNSLDFKVYNLFPDCINILSMYVVLIYTVSVNETEFREWSTALVTDFSLPWIISRWNWVPHVIQMLKWCWTSHNCTQGRKKLHRRKFCTIVYTAESIFITQSPMALQECELWMAKENTVCSRACQKHGESFLWLWESFGLSPYYKSKLYGLI